MMKSSLSIALNGILAVVIASTILGCQKTESKRKPVAKARRVQSKVKSGPVGNDREHHIPHLQHMIAEINYLVECSAKAEKHIEDSASKEDRDTAIASFDTDELEEIRATFESSIEFMKDVPIDRAKQIVQAIEKLRNREQGIRKCLPSFEEEFRGDVEYSLNQVEGISKQTLVSFQPLVKQED